MPKKNLCRQLRDSDIKRMKKQAADQALKYGIILFLTVMRDKEGYGLKRLKRLYEELIELADSINKGYVNWHDLEKVLVEEANITVVL